MTSDLINGLFEFVGACFMLLNVRAVQKDQDVKGFRLLPLIFFTGWGVWNLYFYPHLGQWFSFTGGVCMILVNVAYIVLVVTYR